MGILVNLPLPSAELQPRVLPESEWPLLHKYLVPEFRKYGEDCSILRCQAKCRPTPSAEIIIGECLNYACLRLLSP